MNRILLIHWNDEELIDRARSLEEAGYEVFPSSEFGPHDMKGIVDLEPNAIVIDLTRLPARGRDVGLHLRGQKKTRAIPLHFIVGDPDKTARVRRLLPDAGFSVPEQTAGVLRDTIRNAPADPVVPGIFEPYADTPLQKKLGLRNDSILALLGAPPDFDSTLGAVPPEARIRRQARGESDIILLFVRSLAELRRRFPAAEKILKQGGRLWLIWPKKASGVKSDLTQQVVRGFGLGTGLVDFKVISIDATWSGLCFTRRRKRSI